MLIIVHVIIKEGCICDIDCNATLVIVIYDEGIHIGDFHFEIGTITEIIFLHQYNKVYIT